MVAAELPLILVWSFNCFKSYDLCEWNDPEILLDFVFAVKAATVIFISGRGSTISSSKEGKSGSINNLVKS